ncbi:phosphodiester glycosidase family protein [Paractinoplanes globisporus]|uniref:Phosphodiester glycosidase family protein n=1 Tax=Paractinoplanes globisporus TaxID=113565 RepID=A0ABW6WDG8_9ACTN|nr:phosphodiester glycosidase family protein [Actinoplanes globisporus]
MSTSIRATPGGVVRRGRKRRVRTARQRRLRRVVAIAVALILIGPAISYGRALTAPGSATWQMRTVDWIRLKHGGALVNAIENWWYTRHKPAAGPPDAAALPRIGSGPAKVIGPATLPRLPGVALLPGESTWSPGRTGASGLPLVYTAFLRPDPAHLSVVAGVAWIRTSGTTTHLVAGTTQPGGPVGPDAAAVPTADIGKLVATFNSGFKMQDIAGGFYLDGRTARPLAAGQASLVIDKDGVATVGAWGRDVRMTAGVVAVRQNLALVVDHGRPVAGLSTNADGRWGSAHNQYQYTWRSGVGIDAHGNLIYVAGDKMNLATLAAAMADAGVVRGMQLDIHSGMASFASWEPLSGANGSAPTKLLPRMPRSAYRYLNPDQRDFFYVTAN